MQKYVKTLFIFNVDDKNGGSKTELDIKKLEKD